MSTKVKLLTEKAVMPSRAHETDSGWDITIININSIKGDTVFFGSGVAVRPPAGHYFEIYLRSSCSELPIMLANSVGIIDSGYRSEIIIPIRILHPNIGTGEKTAQYPSGMIRMLESRPTSMVEVANLILAKKPRIAQMILRKSINTSFVEEVQLDTTERNLDGFGSTGDK